MDNNEFKEKFKKLYDFYELTEPKKFNASLKNMKNYWNYLMKQNIT